MSRATHIVFDGARSTACGLPLSGVLTVGRPNCIRCRRVVEARTVPRDDHAQRVWCQTLKYLVRTGQASSWVRDAWERECRDKDRVRGRKYVRDRRANMTIEERRAEWKKYQRARRERLERSGGR